jgi:hypothetical protein
LGAMGPCSRSTRTTLRPAYWLVPMYGTTTWFGPQAAKHVASDVYVGEVRLYGNANGQAVNSRVHWVFVEVVGSTADHVSLSIRQLVTGLPQTRSEVSVGATEM